MKRKMQVLTLDFLPTSLNEYINAERSNRFMAAKIKKEETEAVYYAVKEQGLKPIKVKVRVEFEWRVKNRKKDPDNVSFAKKYILDGMSLAGVIENDGWNNISGFSDSFELNENEGVIVKIYEV